MYGQGHPIAYVYEADYHCPRCALERFGRDEHGDITGVDGEGNEVGALAPWDEWHANDIYEGRKEAILACGTCGEVIERLDLTD